MLTMGLAADSGESVALDYALETLTFGSTDDIYEVPFSDYIAENHSVAQLELIREVGREFDQLAMGGCARFLKMPFERGAGMFLCRFVIGKLNGGIAVLFNRTYLRDNTWTSLNDGAWNIFSISTENGSHSDFLSN